MGDKAFAERGGAGHRCAAAPHQRDRAWAERAVIADTDLRLTRSFGLNEGFCLRLQMDYELQMQKRALGKELEAIKPRA